jgi:F420-dependent oxidoreductase-like protein
MDLVGVPPTEHWPVMLDVASRIEGLGYDSLWVYDHFHTVPDPSQEPTFEAWSLMAALAVATERVRLGQMCTCNSYRPPSYLAKVASTIDVMSGGRLEFAIGAGWYEEEYLAYGYEFPRASVRIGQLDEAIRIVKAMWTDEEASFEGRYYRIDGAINQPKPLQQPHPPIWVAGGGEKLTLRVVAEHADFSNYAGNLETFRKKGQILDRHCETIGRDPAEIGRTAHLIVVVASDEASLPSVLERCASQGGRPVEKYLSSPIVIAGTAPQVVEELAGFRAAGCAHVIAYLPDTVWGEGLEVFAEEVVPQLR